ncbi:MAG: thymidine phosphorylase [Kordiimonadaceae bacterium]|nr:thymidine phosphorylase [Kordiimonadaceae bacterium]MBO6567249.1 thymidine phosphorylase [Kordiimonadaceae bacterium]MBO6963537.1 thymidine phosphorylase [Kordiimonadaceae bacterium]
MSDILIPQAIIQQKRDGQTVSEADIARFVEGITDGRVTDAQIAAFGMAVFFNGMSPQEGAALTLSMRDSGDVIDWTSLGFDAEAPIVDKHSTGGVGDKVSLMLAPIVAACGGLVPMISGRGLGHTGGTLDKFEAIPGYDPYPSIERFAEIVRDVGCSIIGQTGELAPADKRFYAVRDVTATVESIPLITASILSKKLSAGLNSLIMDVKFGSGAFMADYDKAKELAENIVRVAGAAGTPTRALLTDMNQVLGRTAGNAVEVIESVEFLTNPSAADSRLVDVTLALAAHMLHISGVSGSVDEALQASQRSLDDGSAAVVFEKMVAAQGGPNDILSSLSKHVTVAEQTFAVSSDRAGFVSEQDTRAIGMAVVAMGGGRTDPSAKIDHAVGLTDIVQIGDRIEVGDPLAVVQAHDLATAERAAEEVKSAVKLSDTEVSLTPVVAEIIEG